MFRSIRTSSVARLTRTRVGALAKRSLVDLVKARQLWNGRLVFSEEVEHALQSNDPVIALESTIITHGMPPPANFDTAVSLESILRDKGVTPATIALLDGKIHVGLSTAQLTRLADTASLRETRVKVSRRDIGPALAGKLVGGTTVASTMYIGQSVGIPLFVTGGIGGVHRGAETSMDVSADLIELGRTGMGVVCAGAKSILDIPRTLEVLETQGVCVATYGDSPDFPAFYTPSSGQKSPWTVDDALSAAELIDAGLSLPTPLSTLLAVPIPAEHASVGNAVQEAVELAVRESIEQGIDKRGKEVTPWLLKRVGELTAGRALNLNIKLIENNARVGASVAVELARIRRESKDSHASMSAYSSAAPASAPFTSGSPALIGSVSTATGTPLEVPLPGPTTDLPPPRVIVFGSAAMDLTSHSSQPLSPRSTTPGSIYLTPGGVGRNIAEAAQNLLPPKSVMLVSALGTDAPNVPDAVGKMLLLEMAQTGMRTDGLIQLDGERSAACSLVLEGEGDLVNGVADMSIVERLTEDLVRKTLDSHKPGMVVFDLNPRPEVIKAIARESSARGIPTFCDPTSIPKLPRLVSVLTSLLPGDVTVPRPLTHLSPNLLELDLLHTSLTSDTLPDDVSDRSWQYINGLNLGQVFRAKVEAFTNHESRTWMRDQGVIPKAIACLSFVQSFWIKCGYHGIISITISPRPIESSASGKAAGISHQLDGSLSTGEFLNICHDPANKRLAADEVVSTTGAGDTASGSLVAGLSLRQPIASDDNNSSHKNEGSGQRSEQTAVESFVTVAMERAERSIRSRRAVG